MSNLAEVAVVGLPYVAMSDNRRIMESNPAEQFDTIVIGAGQTGLMVGYELSRSGVDYVVLDANERVGDAWRKRWDSLRLFTPAWMNGLPGLPFPAHGADYVSKDQVADYLEGYARHMALPVRNGVRVEGLTRSGDGYVVRTNAGTFEARNVVVAMANYQVPKLPDFAPELDPGVVQMHSSQYRNPSQLQEGGVLVVGMGNSGADIALEVAQTHSTFASGKETGHIPFRLERWFGRWIGVRVVRFAAVNVLNTSTPIGRRARPKMLTKAAPLVRVKPKDLAAAGVERVDRIEGVVDGVARTEAGRALDVANVIWCTGFEPGFAWIDLPVFDETGKPRHERGVVVEQPGLYFVGLFFLHSLWSETLTGMQADARYVVGHLVNRSGVPQAAMSVPGADRGGR